MDYRKLKKSNLVFIFPIVLFFFVFSTILLSYQSSAYASTNANLFVSAENSQWNNYFAGPQVIQVIVSDTDINRLDQVYGEPVVTVNGKQLRMMQATDGNWYAYFADRNQAIAADKTSGMNGKGLDFGQFCSSTSHLGTISFSETKGFTVSSPITGSINKPANATAFGLCTGTNTIGSRENHVVRENKTLTSANGLVKTGQLGIPDSNMWPIIQLYDFSAIPTPVIIDYQKSGGDQTVNLTFDKIPQNLINATSDKYTYSQNSGVFITIDDPQLNIDPTDINSWTWGANASNNALYYEAFDRNGLPDADGTLGMQNLIGNLTIFMFNHNGKFTVNPSASGVRIIDFQKNTKQQIVPFRGDPSLAHTLSIGTDSEPITFEENTVNSGVFTNWDGGKKSNIMIIDSKLIRNQSASFRYNDISSSIVGGFFNGAITMHASNNMWASGQRIPVTLIDGDANKNSKVAEHLSLDDPNVARITTMKIGFPFTLKASNVTLFSGMISSTRAGGIVTLNLHGAANVTTTDIAQDEVLSARPIYKQASNVIISNGGMIIDLHTSMQKLKLTIHNSVPGNSENFKGFNFLNYDIRSLGITTGGVIKNIEVFLAHHTGPISDGTDSLASGVKLVSIANSTSLQDFINLNVTSSKVANPVLVNHNLFAIPDADNTGLVFIFKTSAPIEFDAIDERPVVIDFFSIGLIGDGTQATQRVNNGIYRFELEETGDNTGVFTGTNQYLMLNQLNIFDPNTYSSLRTISHDVYFPVIQDMIQSANSAPQIAYLDLGQDGTDTQISAQQDISTHTGVISFDSKSYKIGDTVTITLNDQDLNVDNDLIDIYTVVLPVGLTSTVQDVATDTIGRSGLGNYSDGTPFGVLVDVEFGKQNIRWSNSNIPGQTHNVGACFGTSDSNTGTAEGLATSLSATGFALVETGPSTGVFTGTFEIPDQVCQYNTIVSTEGQNIKINYHDFRDSAGNTVVVSDNAVIKTDVRNEKFRILLKSGFFIPSSTPSLALNIASIRGGLSTNNTVHFLLQFSSLPNSTVNNILVQNDINLTDYLTANTYIASTKVSNLNNLANIPNIRWVGQFVPDFKISPPLNPAHLNNIPGWALLHMPFVGPPGSVSNMTKVVLNVVLNKDVDLKNAVTHLLPQNFVISGQAKIGGIASIIRSVTVVIDNDILNSTINYLARDDDVQFIDFVDPALQELNDRARSVSGVDMVLNEHPYPALNGSGVKVLVYDGGTVGDHPDFDDRIILHNNAPTIWHATHVAGILGGSGVNSNKSPHTGTLDQWRGIAPGVKIISYGFKDLRQDQSFLPYENADAMQQNFTEAIDYGINIATMSLGANVGQNFWCHMNYNSQGYHSYLGNYTDTSLLIDSIVEGGIHGVPVIFFEAAGNNRGKQNCPDFGSIDPPAAAKNSIVVGAINTEGIPMTDYSSFGPTEDGRIKPDIVAPGSHDNNTGLTSTTYPGGGYYVASGTSQATPVAAGVAALLYQEWNQTHIIYGPPNKMMPLFPHTVKAILIHTATDLGNPGPDYEYGWGAVNATSAIDLIINDQADHMIHEDSVSQTGDTNTYSFNAPADQCVKVTLVWDDLIGSPNTVPNLVNDLSLTLTGPDGYVYMPFVLDPTHPEKNATRGNDDKNNVEMVVGKPSTTTGMWTVTIQGTHILGNHQSYAWINSTIPNKPGSICTSQTPSVVKSLLSNITVHKTVDNGISGGGKQPSDFTISISNSTNTYQLTIDQPMKLSPGQYAITESGPSGFTGTFTGDCLSGGTVDLKPGDDQNCYISNSHCLIATAAFGSELTPQVQFLRDFRDHRILSTHDGSSFMTVFNTWYYSFSPSVADYERSQPWLQQIIKTSIYPLLGILTASEKVYSLIPGDYGSLFAGIVASALIGSVYFWPFALLFPQVRHENHKFNFKFVLTIFGIVLVSTLLSIIVANSFFMMMTTSLLVLSFVAIFALLSSKTLVLITKFCCKT